MNPALKRKLIMPFVKWQWNKKMEKQMRTAAEVESKMKECHEEFLTIQKQGKLDTIKSTAMANAALKRDILMWVLKLDGSSS